jgi:hypothetical protein
LPVILVDQSLEVLKATLDQGSATLERGDIPLVAGKQKAAVNPFQCRYVIFNQATEPDYFDGVRAKSVLGVIAGRDVKKDSGEEEDNNRADGGTGEEF